MYRKFRFYFRLFTAFTKKYLKVVVFGLLLGIVGFFIIPPLLTRLPQIRQTQKIGMIGKYSLNNLPLSIQQKISIGLTTIDASGSAAPGIASSWEATDSGKTYIFTLNPKLYWQDKKPLVSSDIKFNFRDAKIDYPDPGHLLLRLPDSFSPLPTIVSTPIFKVVTKTGLFPDIKYYGLGAYQIQSYRKNGSYLDTITLTPTDIRSHLPKLQYFFYPSQATARTAFKLGIVSEINNIQDLGELISWPNTTITPEVMSDRYVAVFFNVTDPNFTGPAGKNLRLSLAYAIDKSRYSPRVYGPISSSSWAYDPDLRRYDLDLIKSKSLLQKVEKVPSKITISVLSTYLSTAESVKSDWEKLGISVDIQVVPEIPSTFQVLIAAQSMPYDPDQYNYWHSTKSTNLTGIKNPRIDKKLEDGRKTFDLEERKALYFDFQVTLADEAPVIFLYSPKTLSISRK